MRHRGTERRFARRPFGIDVDELMVFGNVGESIDPALIDGVPGGKSDFLANEVEIGVACNRQAHSGPAAGGVRQQLSQNGSTAKRNMRKFPLDLNAGPSLSVRDWPGIRFAGGFAAPKTSSLRRQGRRQAC